MNKNWIPISLSGLALTGCFSEEAKEVEAVAEPLKVTAADKIYYGGDILTMAGDKPEYAEAVATYQASKTQRSWLNSCYKYLRAYDKEYSAAKGFPESVKLTTVKPSGTLSLLAGVTPGGHPSPAGPYYIRRVRMAADSPLVDTCKNHGYHVEYQRNFDGTDDHTTKVVSFPCKVPAHTPIGGNTSAVEQLEMVKELQTVWSDNSVSITVYYTKEELDEVKNYLALNYSNNFKTVSFLLYSGHGFDQAPYETVTKEEYDSLKQGTTPITSVEVNEGDTESLGECAGGACPIK